MNQLSDGLNIESVLNGAAVDDTASAPHMLMERLKVIKPFLDDPSLTEICINRPGELWTESRRGWECHIIPDLNFARLLQLAKLIAGFNKKKISADYPVLSSSLPTGERTQVVIPPACEGSTVSITIRKPSLVDKTLDELEAEGAFEHVEDVKSVGELHPWEKELLGLKQRKQIKEFLKLAMEKGLTLVIVGKTGSGKTTVGKSITNCIPTTERLITIEDVPEMALNLHGNKVHLFFSRDDEGGSKVTAKQAVASCLRMKPDRILLAEMRGDEAWEFVKAVASGHPGVSTAHAAGAIEAFDQIVALIKDSPTGSHLDSDYIKRRLFQTIDIVLFYANRKLVEIYYDPELKRKQMA